MNPVNDMEPANRTYDRFVGLLKWSVPVIAIIVFVVLMLIT